MNIARAGARRLPLGLDWTRREALVPYAFLLPSFVALAVVFFYPMLHAVVLSFHANAIGVGPSQFVGFSQYTAVLTSPYFPRVLATSILWTVGNVVFVLAFGMASALMLDRRFPARSIVRALFILPWAIPYVATALIWGWMFDYEFGVLNYLTVATGMAVHKLNFLLGCPDALISLTGVSVWKLFPLGTVMFLAGLQTIPAEYYEAAKVDGASALQAFRYVTLPGVRNVSIMLTLLITIWTFGRTFTIIFLLTEGGPAGCTENIVIRSYLEAFKFFHIGTASALGVIVLAISLMFALAYLAYVYRSDWRHG